MDRSYVGNTITNISTCISKCNSFIEVLIDLVQLDKLF